jgi:hypothetical protein
MDSNGCIWPSAKITSKTTFLSELVWACQQKHLPTIIGGRGILTLCGTIKRQIMIDLTTIGFFNAVIDSFDLRVGN